MSRRREALELARALHLSTQEAHVAAHQSPHTLSSSKSGTQDSREMELQAVNLAMLGAAAEMRQPGMPPLVQTYEDDRRAIVPRRMDAGPALSADADPIVSVSTSNIDPSIASFTPSRSQQQHAAGTFQPIPGSSHSKPTTGSSDTRPPYSSPNMPIPSSRLSGSKGGADSSGSSHRPLFSPTQTSDVQPPIAGPSHPAHAGPNPPKIKFTYGKQSSKTSPVKAATDGTDTTRRRSSPLKPAGPPLWAEMHHVLSSSDEEIEEEIEEPLISRPPGRTTIEVVMPTRETRAPSRGVSPRHADSPDPLDSNLKRARSVTSVSRTPVVKSSAVSNATASSSKRGQSTAPQESQASATSAGGHRVSRRVLDKMQKEAEEKEARREARRLRKEQERLKAEAETAGQDEAMAPLEEESIVPLESQVGRNAIADRKKSRYFKEPTAETEAAVEHVDVNPLDSLDTPSKLPARPTIFPAHIESPDRVQAQPHDEDEDVVIMPAAKKRKKVMFDEEEDFAKAPEEDDMDDWAPMAAKKKAKGKEKAPKRAPVKSKKGGKKADKAPQFAPEEPAAEVITETVAQEIEAAQPAEAEHEAMEIVPEPEVERQVSPEVSLSPAPEEETQSRPPLKPISNLNSASPAPLNRSSPGPSNLPGGIKWKTNRSDLSTVLSKFGGARQSGMSRRYRIAPLHATIGPPVKALPPPPPKPSKKKKEESDEDEDESGEEESDGEGGVRKKKKERGLEWYMVED